ncbi:hypothetical protein [Pedobacter boryungensis]|uniref:Uncharacterized protein n=1 Tax=Pedobacter boryungensis TaxID=869962 RepID=A0ABX2DII1_9SPHI|nr:hypothetical protein [Pedobacter boryungensis]NQX32929.1 hypothetical protein [Pedobacter boryungensis]
MSKIYETGHAKNVANFETLISFVIGYGAIYNPSNTLIGVGNMQGQLAKAKNAVNDFYELFANLSNAVVAREVAFRSIKKLSTRLLNALKATDTPIQVIDNVAAINRKLQGKRASGKLTDERKAELLAHGKVVNQVSASQLSYDNILDNFYKLIQQLDSIPQYKPNEIELKVVTLTSQCATLRQLNAAVVTHEVALGNVRLLRNEVMYNLEVGLIANAQQVKAYLKSVFGATSEYYKQVSGIPFRMMRNL